jgi:hypothetical protein
MMRRITLFMLVTIATGLIASTAWASSPPSGIIADASDGVINGSYSAAQVRAAINTVRTDPVYSQYSDIEGVLVDYLGGLGMASHAGATGGGSAGSQSTASSTGTSSSSSQTRAKGGNGKSTGKSSTPAASQTGSGSGLNGQGDVIAAGTLPTPPPSIGSEQAGSRLSALPWFFASIAAGVVAVSLALLHRRRRAG